MTVEYQGPLWLRDWVVEHQIKGFDRVTGLVVNGAQFDDSVVTEISRLKHLKSVQLHNTSVTPTGIARLKEVVGYCRITKS